jgi:adenylosuccinate synthase
MPSLVIVGTQWGDEGKGKIVDYCAKDAHCVVRYQGGANAGHTIIADGRELKLQMLPSGVLHEKQVMIGAGVVIDPGILVNEIKNVQSMGLDLDLIISWKAHITLPYHNALDRKWEQSRNLKKIGTTGRGIGPTYEDKMKRQGIRVSDIVGDKYKERVRINVDIANKILRTILHEAQEIDSKEILDYCAQVRPTLNRYSGDVSIAVNQALDENKNVLFEGAQATMLDIDHGTYPFVTSSNPVAGGACTGVGVGPTRIDHVIGVCKAYATRVGEGPFPTELNNEEAEHLQKLGKEFGTVTSRPRRCGWLDLNIIRYAKRINGLTGIALTKIDVLNGLKKVKICNSYIVNGQELRELPIHQIEDCEPIYLELNGWDKLFEGDSLNPEAKKYIDTVEREVGVPIYFVSTGPRRDEVICLRNVW